jgi:hypothetical protein
MGGEPAIISTYKRTPNQQNRKEKRNGWEKTTTAIDASSAPIYFSGLVGGGRNLSAEIF